MADIVDNPSKLTKELLRKTLIKYDVPLPGPKARKDEYVKLYKKHLIDRPQKFDFSSDEEVIVVSQKATKQVKVGLKIVFVHCVNIILHQCRGIPAAFVCLFVCFFVSLLQCTNEHDE